MDWPLYIRLSLMMFLQFAIWGAWSPVLAARLLGPLKMSGKQTGWIYGTIFLGCIVAPLIAGQVADRWVPTQWFLAGAHLVGGVLLLLAARKRTFWGLFGVMGLYALCYASSLPLVNSLMFSHLTDAKAQSAGIFIWAPIAWVLAGWLLTGIRRLGKGGGEGSDCLVLAGVLSLVMGAYCLFLPHTAPAGGSWPIVEALGMLKINSVLILLIVSFVLASQLQFYFLGTARYLGDLGVQDKNVPAVMTIAQVAQTLVTLFALGFVLKEFGFVWALAAGALAWTAMYIFYATMQKWLVIVSMAFHGIAYVLFIIVSQIFMDVKAPEGAKGSAQALIFVVTMGFGLFLGTQFTGAIMDAFATGEGKFRWRAIYLVPCGLTLACAIVLAALFRG
ncbi:MAG: MFS transporter [Phycisphaerae bacterium]|nr:MFS transporter [Phycisphaerae bacterium]